MHELDKRNVIQNHSFFFASFSPPAFSQNAGKYFFIALKYLTHEEKRIKHHVNDRTIRPSLSKIKEVYLMTDLRNQEALTVEEVALILRMGRTSAYEWMKKGPPFPLIRVANKLLRIPTRPFFAWFDGRETNNSSLQSGGH